MVGGDRDAYGCIPSAGYQWCELKEKCIRSWEESCSSSTSYTPTYTQTQYAPITYDSCDRASGYIWCAAKQTCIQPWMESCASPNTSPYYPTTNNTIQSDHGCIAAQGFYWCEAQNACIRTGTTCNVRRGQSGCASTERQWDGFGCDRAHGEGWCDSKQACINLATESCPNDLYAPRMMRSGCTSSYTSSSVQAPPPDRDTNGCRRDYGYKWCSSLDKCYRPWEERCPEAVDPVAESCTQTSRSRICIGSPGFQWCESKRACVKIGTKCK